jgi:hypothetical protein
MQAKRLSAADLDPGTTGSIAVTRIHCRADGSCNGPPDKHLP